MICAGNRIRFSTSRKSDGKGTSNFQFLLRAHILERRENIVKAFRLKVIISHAFIILYFSFYFLPTSGNYPSASIRIRFMISAFSSWKSESITIAESISYTSTIRRPTDSISLSRWPWSPIS